MKLGRSTAIYINFSLLSHFWTGHIKTAPWLWPAAWKSRPWELVLALKWFLAKGGGAVSGWGWLGVQVQSHPPPLEPPPPPNSNLWPQILWHLQEEEGCSFYNSGWDNNTNKSFAIGKSESREKSKNRKKLDKIGKIGSDFLSDFLAKMPKCHKLP